MTKSRDIRNNWKWINADYNCLFLSCAHSRNKAKLKTQQKTKRITGKPDQLTEAYVKSIHECYGDDMGMDITAFKLARDSKMEAPLVNQATWWIPFRRLLWKHLIKPMPLSIQGSMWQLRPFLFTLFRQLDGRIKTSLRNTMTGERLSSLAILHIHKHKDVYVVNVITKLSQKRGGASPCACKHSSTSLKKKSFESFFEYHILL